MGARKAAEVLTLKTFNRHCLKLKSFWLFNLIFYLFRILAQPVKDKCSCSPFILEDGPSLKRLGPLLIK